VHTEEVFGLHVLCNYIVFSARGMSLPVMMELVLILSQDAISYLTVLMAVMNIIVSQ
jgi:hypothetical protein